MRVYTTLNCFAECRPGMICYVCTCICVYACMYVWIYECMYVCMFVWVCMYVCASMCVCMSHGASLLISIVFFFNTVVRWVLMPRMYVPVWCMYVCAFTCMYSRMWCLGASLLNFDAGHRVINTNAMMQEYTLPQGQCQKAEVAHCDLYKAACIQQ